jgi:8-oxo-dGTP pyrophosphatase MutT (NUDIX family)
VVTTRAATPVPSAAVPHPAATVVLLRPAGDRTEVLLIHRPATMAFGPGLHAFPGGRVDGADAIPDRDGDPGLAAWAGERLGGILPDRDALAVHRAAVREVLEEVGIALRPADLAPIALWTTPPFMTRRFATWFFVADLPPDQEPVFAADEVAAHVWLEPTAALEARAAGSIEMWVPTTSVLERLVALDATRASRVVDLVRIRRPEPPRVMTRSDAETVLAVGGVGGLPGRPGRVRLVGRSEMVVVDPGDPTEDAIDAIRAAADERGGAIRAIVLTRPDSDHAAGAEALAIPLGTPVLVAPGGARRLPHDATELEDGAVLPTDVGASVRLGPPGSATLEVVVSGGGTLPGSG